MRRAFCVVRRRVLLQQTNGEAYAFVLRVTGSQRETRLPFLLMRVRTFCSVRHRSSVHLLGVASPDFAFPGIVGPRSRFFAALHGKGAKRHYPITSALPSAVPWGLGSPVEVGGCSVFVTVRARFHSEGERGFAHLRPSGCEIRQGQCQIEWVSLRPVVGFFSPIHCGCVLTVL